MYYKVIVKYNNIGLIIFINGYKNKGIVIFNYLFY